MRFEILSTRRTWEGALSDALRLAASDRRRHGTTKFKIKGLPLPNGKMWVWQVRKEVGR